MTLQRYAVFLNLQNSHKTAGTLWVFHIDPSLMLRMTVKLYKYKRLLSMETADFVAEKRKKHRSENAMARR